MTSAKRHSWGDRRPYLYKTERDCQNGCGVTMVTHHQVAGTSARTWSEFVRNGEVIAKAGEPRPICEPFKASVVTP